MGQTFLNPKHVGTAVVVVIVLYQRNECTMSCISAHVMSILMPLLHATRTNFFNFFVSHTLSLNSLRPDDFILSEGYTLVELTGRTCE